MSEAAREISTENIADLYEEYMQLVEVSAISDAKEMLEDNSDLARYKAEKDDLLVENIKTALNNYAAADDKERERIMRFNPKIEAWFDLGFEDINNLTPQQVDELQMRIKSIKNPDLVDVGVNGINEFLAEEGNLKRYLALVVAGKGREEEAKVILEKNPDILRIDLELDLEVYFQMLAKGDAINTAILLEDNPRFAEWKEGEDNKLMKKIIDLEKECNGIQDFFKKKTFPGENPELKIYWKLIESGEKPTADTVNLQIFEDKKFLEDLKSESNKYWKAKKLNPNLWQTPEAEVYYDSVNDETTYADSPFLRKKLEKLKAAREESKEEKMQRYENFKKENPLRYGNRSNLQVKTVLEDKLAELQKNNPEAEAKNLRNEVRDWFTGLYPKLENRKPVKAFAKEK